MFAHIVAPGFTVWTFLAVIAGLVVHALKQVSSARGTALDPRTYFLDNWVELATGAICGVVLWLASPQLISALPDVAHAVGLTGVPTIVSSFSCGFCGNSLADLLGNRFKSISGGG